jgi:hypothetical protein
MCGSDTHVHISEGRVRRGKKTQKISVTKDSARCLHDNGKNEKKKKINNKGMINN